MSFKSKILIFIILVLVVSLTGTLLLNLSNTQAFLEKQLQSHANDTATSLGLSLSSVADVDEPSRMQTMIDAVFDRGHFANITLTDVNGELIYARTKETTNSAIPDWFVRAVEISIPAADAVVQSGWMPVGNLQVHADKGYAHIELWLSFKQVSLWFLLTAALFLAIAYSTLQILLRPLQRVTQQAEAIVNKQYIIQQSIPRTAEFRKLVLGMNEMVDKLEKVFSREANVAEKLRTIAYHDADTGLHNSYYFETIFNGLLSEHKSSAEGSMCLLKIDGLKEFNDHYGYQLGNSLVKYLADQLRCQLAGKEHIFIRMNGTELLAILPSKRPADLEPCLKSLSEIGGAAQQHFNLDGPAVDIAIAAVSYQPRQTRASILARLSFTLQQAEAGESPYAIEQADQTETFNREVWLRTLNTAIAEKRFQLYKQSSFTAEHTVHDSELLIRMRDENGNLLSAAYFMPAVEQLNLQLQIDELVVQLALEYLSQADRNDLFAINLSAVLLEDPSRFHELEQLLGQAKTDRLAFEFSEGAIAHNLEGARAVFNRLQGFGFAMGIDRFGMQPSSLRSLQELRPSYIKLDGAFSERIESDEQTRLYVASIVDSASSLDIRVVATSVEDSAQQRAFAELGINYFQGYLFEAPFPL